MRGYYFITDVSLSRAGNLSDVENAVRAQAAAVQYRNKQDGSLKLYEEARLLKAICRGVPFIINDRVDIALAVDADGVHLGQDDLPYMEARRILGTGKIIGLTVHNVPEAQAAESMGADYLGLSPIFATGTKTDAGVPCGLVMLKQVKSVVKIPVVAIGGITLKNAPEVLQAGADAICAISAVVGQDSVYDAILKFNNLYNR